MIKIRLTRNDSKKFSREINSIISREKQNKQEKKKPRVLRVGEYKND